MLTQHDSQRLTRGPSGRCLCTARHHLHMPCVQHMSHYNGYIVFAHHCRGGLQHIVTSAATYGHEENDWTCHHSILLPTSWTGCLHRDSLYKQVTSMCRYCRKTSISIHCSVKRQQFGRSTQHLQVLQAHAELLQKSEPAGCLSFVHLVPWLISLSRMIDSGSHSSNLVRV